MSGRRLGTVRFWLQVSRPGLWFPTLWLYLLPLGSPAGTTTGAGPPWHHPAFWVGLVYCSFPLNFLVYGWNDRVDRGTDRLNPRKGNWLFGARGDDAALDRLPRALAGVTLASFAALAWLDGPRQLLLGLGIAAVCWAYNREPGGWRGRPPLELLCQVGYLLVVPLSAWLNGVPLPPLATWLYLALFTAQSQLMGEVMDIGPDRQAGRATTATRLGTRRTKLLIIAVVAAETALAFAVFGDALFGGALAAFLAWLVLDVSVVFRARPYTLAQMKALGVVSNLMAVASMVYVWQTGCLLG